jgi:hypothetical protein
VSRIETGSQFIAVCFSKLKFTARLGPAVRDPKVESSKNAFRVRSAVTQFWM